MKVIKAAILAAGVAVASLGMGAVANAAPLGSAAKVVTGAEHTSAQPVHYRKYKHRHYRKHRHRHYGYYRGYRGYPSLGIHIGPRYGHHHRHRHHRHHRRWR
jgi:hypothetical protein